MTTRKYIVAAQFQGTPKRSDLKIVEEKLPALNDGGEFAGLHYFVR